MTWIYSKQINVRNSRVDLHYLMQLLLGSFRSQESGHSQYSPIYKRHGTKFDPRTIPVNLFFSYLLDVEVERTQFFENRLCSRTCLASLKKLQERCCRNRPFEGGASCQGCVYIFGSHVFWLLFQTCSMGFRDIVHLFTEAMFIYFQIVFVP